MDIAIDIEPEERKEEPSEITQGEYITLYDKQQETILLKLLKDSFIFEVRRAFDSLIWKGEFTMEVLVKQDSKWSISFEDISEVAGFIKYSFEKSNFKFQISMENMALFSFEIEFGFKKRELSMSIQPKAKDTEDALTEHAQILRDLTDKMGSQGVPETAEAVADLTNRITRIETAPPPISFHKIFRLKTGSWNSGSGNFTNFPAAKGEFNLIYPAFVKWELQLNGHYANQPAYSEYHHQLRLNFKTEEEFNSPDADGIKFRSAGRNANENDCPDQVAFFSDMIELDPGNYQVQLQIAITTAKFYWNNAYGEINLLFIVYPRTQ